MVPDQVGTPVAAWMQPGMTRYSHLAKTLVRRAPVAMFVILLLPTRSLMSGGLMCDRQVSPGWETRRPHTLRPIRDHPWSTATAEGRWNGWTQFSTNCPSWRRPSPSWFLRRAGGLGDGPRASRDK